ncbi:MAG: YbjN domain-containing protein [Anaerolineaceae bacterium]|jgi:hypothetical protein|nr:YbjN domain-containing protein [Anaerolineaceae bacterium]MDD4042433.1 YbjN domain-containing protein [Anaerolineaceae bacterium]MDD4577140.1 YbjN domain-containing protein [Anaerolineaceae bacterium]
MAEPITTKIGQFIQSYDWEFTQEANNEFTTRFVGETTNTSFNLIVNIDEKWISLTVWPYLPNIPEKKEVEALQLICKRNFQIRLARLAMTDQGDIALCLDFPVEVLTEQCFHDSLDVITYYADALFPDFLSFWSEE